jgi:hypothetical protein
MPNRFEDAINGTLAAPAVKLPSGEVVIGQKGQTHMDILDTITKYPKGNVQHGFIDKQGNYANREQSRNKVESRTGVSMPPARAGEPRKPHSEDLRGGFGRAIGMSGVPSAQQEALQSPEIDPVFFGALATSVGPVAALRALMHQGIFNQLMSGMSSGAKKTSQYVNPATPAVPKLVKAGDYLLNVARTKAGDIPN